MSVCVCVCASLSYSPTASGSFASFSFDFFLARLILRSVLHLIVEFSRTFLHYPFEEKDRDRQSREVLKLTAVFVFDQLFVLCLHRHPRVHVKMYQRVYVYECVGECMRERIT